MKAFKAIAAMSRNRVIGAGNHIPWHLPEELRWFQATTTGHTLVMGRKTYESIGKPLPNRSTIVLSRTATNIPGVRVVRSLAEIDPASEPGDVFICGGRQIYELALPFCSDLFLTLVHRQVTGETLFPPFEEQFVAVQTILERPEFTITQYRQRRTAKKNQ